MLRVDKRQGHNYQTQALVHGPTLQQLTKEVPRGGSKLCLPRFLGL